MLMLLLRVDPSSSPPTPHPLVMCAIAWVSLAPLVSFQALLCVRDSATAAAATVVTATLLPGAGNSTNTTINTTSTVVGSGGGNTSGISAMDVLTPVSVVTETVVCVCERVCV